MNDFWKAISAVLITVVLSLAVGKKEKDIAIVLSTTVCCIVACVAVNYLVPVLDFLWELRQLCNVSDELLSALLKAVGIGLVAELASTVCVDAGSSSLGKMLQILGGAAVLSLSVPMFRTLMMIIREMIGQL